MAVGCCCWIASANYAVLNKQKVGAAAGDWKSPNDPMTAKITPETHPIG
jgi:hypothetical protein